MLNWLFGRGDDDKWLAELDTRLDAAIESQEKRNTVKEQELRELTEVCEQKRKQVEVLKEEISRYKKTLNRQQN